MILQRGNFESLEGKVWIYAKNLKCDPKEPWQSYPGIYCSTCPLDVLDLVEKHNLQGEMDPAELISVIEAIKPQIEEEMKLKTGSDSFIGLTFAPLGVIDPSHGLHLEGDILYAGMAENMVVSSELLSCAFRAYNINYSAQIYRSIQELRNGDTPLVERPKEDFRKYTPQGLVQKLTEIAGNISFSMRVGNEQLKRDSLLILRELSHNAPFSSSIESLTSSLLSNNPGSVELSTLYISLIGAIAKEDYGSARNIQDKIRKLS